MSASAPAEREPRILVGTLHTGENEFEAVKEAVRDQRGVRVTHRVFSGLPNREAHRRLYRLFMDEAEGFDLLVKLDADMVLNGPGALARVVHRLASRADVDHAVLEVRDWASGLDIFGLHVYSPRVRWELPLDDLFVDPHPTIPGRRLVVRGVEPPVVIHGPDPGDFQAYRFGVHRALKAVQPGRFRYRAGRGRQQWTLLDRVWRRFVAGRSRSRGRIVLGAEDVLAERVGPGDYSHPSQELRRRFASEHEGRSADAIFERLVDRWSPADRREARFRAAVGPVRRRLFAAWEAVRARAAALLRGGERGAEEVRWEEPGPGEG